MSGKINNRTLLIVFLGLAAILVITRLVTSKKSVRTLDTELVQIDTSKITSIHLYPTAESGNEIVLTKSSGRWTVSKDELQGSADPNTIRYALDALLNLETERLVARSEDKWGDYMVTDSLGTRVMIKEGKKTTLDLMIGKFDYQQPRNQYQGYGRNQFSGVSYVRKSSEDEVYAVEGFLSMNFNQNFNAWRNQSISNINREQLSKIVFEYPADSGFIAQKSESGWIVGGLPADSASMAQYLSGISRKRSSSFEDGFQPGSAPDYEITLEGDNMTPLHIRAYEQEGGAIILNSSINPDSWFRTSREDLFDDLFTRPEDLLGTSGSG